MRERLRRVQQNSISQSAINVCGPNDGIERDLPPQNTCKLPPKTWQAGRNSVRLSEGPKADHSRCRNMKRLGQETARTKKNSGGGGSRSSINGVGCWRKNTSRYNQAESIGRRIKKKGRVGFTTFIRRQASEPPSQTKKDLKMRDDAPN